MINTYADRTQENISHPITIGSIAIGSTANDISQKRRSGEASFKFADHRAETTAQRKLQEIANNGPQARQLRAFQELANKSLQAKQTAQWQALADRVVQRYTGAGFTTLWELVEKVIGSGRIRPGMSVEEIWPIIYDYATKIDPEKPRGEESSVSIDTELQKQGIGIRNAGGFVYMDFPASDKLKEKLIEQRQRGPAWNEMRITLNVVPNHLISVMEYLHRIVSKNNAYQFVTGIKCNNTLAKAAEKMDNIVIYYIEAPGSRSAETKDLLKLTSDAETIGATLRKGRPAMSGETDHPGIGIGEGHDSLIKPRSIIIAQGIVKWDKSGRKKNVEDFISQEFIANGYDILLHMAPKK